MIEPVVTIPGEFGLLLALGWTLAFAFLGLWWGERGRRIDSQKREERIPVIREGGGPRPPTVRTEQPATPAIEDIGAARASYVSQAKAAGFDEMEAAADFDRMMEAHASDVRGG